LGFAPDGRTLASVRYGGAVQLWDPETGRLRGLFPGKVGRVRALMFTPDGRGLITGGETAGWKPEDTDAVQQPGEVTLWDGGTGEAVWRFRERQSTVNCLALTPDGRMLVAGGGFSAVTRYDLRSGAERVTFERHMKQVLSAAITADGRVVASGDREGMI